MTGRTALSDALPACLLLLLHLLILPGDVCESNIFESVSSGNDAVIEVDIGLARRQFSHFKGTCRFFAYVQTLAFAIGGYENVILRLCVDRLRKHGIECDNGHAIQQSCRAEILKPVLRGLHGIEFDFARTSVHVSPPAACAWAK